MSIKIGLAEMPKQMLMFEFPCGETNCSNLGEGELTIRLGTSEYKMPICPAHLMEFSIELDNSKSFGRV